MGHSWRMNRNHCFNGKIMEHQLQHHYHVWLPRGIQSVFFNIFMDAGYKWVFVKTLILVILVTIWSMLPELTIIRVLDFDRYSGRTRVALVEFFLAWTLYLIFNHLNEDDNWPSHTCHTRRTWKWDWMFRKAFKKQATHWSQDERQGSRPDFGEMVETHVGHVAHDIPWCILHISKCPAIRWGVGICHSDSVNRLSSFPILYRQVLSLTLTNVNVLLSWDWKSSSPNCLSSFPLEFYNKLRTHHDTPMLSGWYGPREYPHTLIYRYYVDKNGSCSFWSCII